MRRVLLGPTLPNDLIACDETKQTASVMNGNCATYDENSGVTQIGACPLFQNQCYY